jgi:hypothetical protein
MHHYRVMLHVSVFLTLSYIILFGIYLLQVKRVLQMSLFQRKRNNAFCVYCWVTSHCQKYDNNECRTIKALMATIKHAWSLIPRTPHFCSALKKLGVPRQIFLKVTNMKFHGNPSSGNRSGTSG